MKMSINKAIIVGFVGKDATERWVLEIIIAIAFRLWQVLHFGAAVLIQH